MAKVFYDHLISIQDILVELDEHRLSHNEKVDLIRTVDTTIHYKVMDVMLSHLPQDKHKEFLSAFRQAPFDKKHLTYLRRHKEDIDMEIVKAIEKAKKDMLKDLKKMRISAKK